MPEELEEDEEVIPKILTENLVRIDSKKTITSVQGESNRWS